MWDLPVFVVRDSFLLPTNHDANLEDEPRIENSPLGKPARCSAGFYGFK